MEQWQLGPKCRHWACWARAVHVGFPIQIHAATWWMCYAECLFFFVMQKVKGGDLLKLIDLFDLNIWTNNMACHPLHPAEMKLQPMALQLKVVQGWQDPADMVGSRKFQLSIVCQDERHLSLRTAFIWAQELEPRLYMPSLYLSVVCRLIRKTLPSSIIHMHHTNAMSKLQCFDMLHGLLPYKEKCPSHP